MWADLARNGGDVIVDHEIAGGDPEPEPELTYLPTVTSSPYAVYALDQLVEAWTGKTATVCATGAANSPAATQDITTVDGLASVAAAVTANGVTSVFYDLQDQSGNGLHATQGTAASRIPLRTDNTHRGHHVLTFAHPTTGASSSRFLALPSELATDRSDLTVFVVGSSGGGLIQGDAFMGLGTGTGGFDGFSLMHSNVASTGTAAYGGVGLVDSSFAGEFSRQPTVGQLCVIATQSSLTARRVTAAGTVQNKTATPPTSASLTGGYIGKGPWSTASFCVGDIAAVLIYPRLSDTDITTIREFLETRYDCLTSGGFTDQVLGVGDSITAGTDAWHQNFYWQINKSGSGLTRRVDTRNFGIGGGTAAQVYTNRAHLAALYSASIRNIWHLHEGTNDIAALSSGSISGTEATIYASITDMVTYLHGLGATTKVVVDTIIPRLWAGTTTDKNEREAVRIALNTLIRDGAVTYNYIVCDLAALTEFGPSDAQGTPIQTYYQSDNIHLLHTGYALCQSRVVTAINAALA